MLTWYNIKNLTCFRSLSTTVTYSFGSASAALAALLFPPALSTFGFAATFAFFGAAALVSAAYARAVVPEPAGMSLPAIERRFEDEDRRRR